MNISGIIKKEQTKRAIKNKKDEIKWKVLLRSVITLKKVYYLFIKNHYSNHLVVFFYNNFKDFILFYSW